MGTVASNCEDPGLFLPGPCQSLSQALGIDSLPSVLLAEAAVTEHLKLSGLK